MNKDYSRRIGQILLSTPQGEFSETVMGYSSRIQGGPFRMMDDFPRQDLVTSPFLVWLIFSWDLQLYIGILDTHRLWKRLSLWEKEFFCLNYDNLDLLEWSQTIMTEMVCFLSLMQSTFVVLIKLTIFTHGLVLWSYPDHS